MTLQEYLNRSGVKPAELARDVRCNRSYIHRVISGDKPLSQRAAIRIWRARRVKLGPIAAVADDDIAALARVLGEAA